MAAGDSKVGICNIGLIALGEDPIASLDDNRKAAILCKGRYDQIRRALLRSHPWNFAKRYARLAANTTPPLFGYANAYALPSDALRVLLLPDNELAKYEVVGRDLYTDEGAPLNVVYIADVEDPHAMDSQFVDVLGLTIGGELGEAITQSPQKAVKCFGLATAKLSEGRLSVAQENSPVEYGGDVWLSARS